MDISISFLFLLLLQTPISSSKTFDNNILGQGSSLSVEKSSDQFISPNGVYSAGFFSVGDNAFSFAVWFTKSSPPTAAWMANRDMPVNGKGAKLSLLKNGDLSLTDATGIHIWNSKTFSGNSQPTQLVLSDTGNLVLCTLENVPRLLWQSFDSPTDTLLPEQPFASSSTQLVSSRSQGNYSSGFYKLYFDVDNVLRLLYTGSLISSVYWPLLDKGINLWDLERTTYNSSRIAVFDTSGFFKSSDNYSFKPSDFGTGPQRRLTLDYDGILRMYSLVETIGKWEVSWQHESKPCRVHGVCGPNSLCKYDPYNGRTCSCLPGFKIKNHNDWSYGCELESKINCNRTRVGFLRIPHVDFWGYDIRYVPNSTFSQCQKECMELCNCKGFMIRFVEPRGVHDCFPKFLLINGHRSPEFNGTSYIKLPIDRTFLFSDNNKTQNVSILDCSGLGPVVLDRMYEKHSENESLIRILLWFATGFGCFEVMCILLVLYYLYSTTNQGADNTTQGYILVATGFKRFSYGVLKKVTHGFSEEIGRGAGGIVYKGTLADGRVAAIKRLNEANQGEAEFLAEISSIGKLNHMNLIKMWGYCVEGKHRLLVYEHIKHGSLAENLSSNQLQWDTRFEIAVGTAKGLAYLHEECLEWILHCDIKPQNILLDSDYQPKVADFGLSKLLNRGGGGLNNSSFSRVRGTRGYMAPEWVYNLPITAKVDLYSYGMVVLEMITGKSPTGTLSVDHHGRLVTWVKEKMNTAAATRDHSWVEEILDPSLGCEYDINKMEVLVRVALLCLEDNKDSRPTMRQVVEMLASPQ
ncbi:hypothetical protein Q3G72_029811 [Acer saccharum]|nr:hypothetical protein Q3G72_029811 [Acer saccharum]